MRYRITFLIGLAMGFVLGTRAGRERYEQMRRGARAVMQNSTVRSAGSAVGHGTGHLVSSAGQRMGEQLGGRVGPHLPNWVPGSRPGAPDVDAWASAAEVHHNGHSLD